MDTGLTLPARSLGSYGTPPPGRAEIRFFDREPAISPEPVDCRKPPQATA